MRVRKLIPGHPKTTVLMSENLASEIQNQKALIALVHEIRNPLTALQLSNELMLDEINTDNIDKSVIQSYLMIVRRNISRIQSYLKDILSFNAQEVAMGPVNIGDCLDRAVSLAQDRIYLSKATMCTNYSDDHWVTGNTEKLTQAFLNIIINAVEAMEVGKGKLWISVYAIHNTIRVVFKDNGVGMEEDTAKKIFDPYFSTKQGLGIGLCTVKDIVALHKAQIVADSLPDIGTSISILMSCLPGKHESGESKAV